MRAVFPKLIAGGLLLAGLAVPALSTAQYNQTPPAAPAPMPSHEAGEPPAAPAPERPNPLKKLIEGRENEPAETVFKNIQLLKGVPAARFLEVMEGFSAALGTNCKKCHDTENFASDDKGDKKVARGMIQMTKGVNEQFLRTMPGLDQDATVSCYTCHRGQSHPPSKPGKTEEHEHEHHH